MPLSPDIAQINELVQAARATAPPPTPALIREGWAQLIGGVGTTTTTCSVEPIDIAGLKSLLFTPPEHDDGLLVWFHGGGWVIGSPELAVNEVDRLSVAGRCRSVSVDYRLAPEHPFPASQLDAIAAVTWCLEHADELGIDRSKVAVGGDSAGGNLAAVAAQRVPGVAAQVLVYPAADVRPESRATYVHTEGYLLDADAMDFFFSCAVGDADLSDPLLSPQLATHDVLAAAPPAYVITAEYDPLATDGRRYAATLRDAGVPVQAAHFDGQMHGFFSMPEVIEDARTAIEGAGSFLVTHLS